MVYSGGLILAGLFGILLIVTSDDVWEFDQTWVSLALRGVDRHERRVPRHDLPRPAAPGRPDRSQLGLAIMDILLIVMLYLMIWKPGV